MSDDLPSNVTPLRQGSARQDSERLAQLAQLSEFDYERVRKDVAKAMGIPVAPGRAPLALMSPGADHALYIALQISCSTASATARRKSPRRASLMVVLVIAGSFGDALKSANSTLTAHLDGRPAYTASAAGNSTTSSDTKRG